MGKSAERATKQSASHTSASPFFKSGGTNGAFFQPKLQVGAPGDHLEQEADRAADRAMAAPAGQAPAKTSFFKASPAVQRQPQDQTSKVLTEGLSLTYDELKDKPGFDEWKEKETKALKYRLWENQPTDLKFGIVTFGLASAGILGSTLSLDPHYRGAALTSLQDTNVALPLGLLPYSEYFPLSGFKYKLPTAAGAPYTFQTELDFDAWFKLARKKLDIPKVSLSVGIDSAAQQGGFTPFTGGHIKLKFGGGIVNLSGYINEPLPPTPMLISDPTKGESPVWLMRSLPGQLESNLPKGSGVFITVDVLRLLGTDAPKRDVAVQRKENSSGSAPGTTGTATPAVMQELHSGTAEALPESTRALMEQRLGSDFSGVRIHQGEQAAESAQSISARAYTSGNDIVFNSGEYQPQTSTGQRLLAHELVHTLQQTGGVQRKDQPSPSPVVKDLRNLLENDNYRGACLKLSEVVPWDDESAKKAWLAGEDTIRLLFLKKLPATLTAGLTSLGELMVLDPKEGFPIVDCWYQKEREKRTLYEAKPLLFDHFLAAISPYSGKPIVEEILQLIGRIDSKRPLGDFERSPEFHDIDLLATSVEQKIRFYDRFKGLNLLGVVQKKFDPFTGLSISEMERQTETPTPDRAKALAIHAFLKNIPDEDSRRAFIETALFAGSLEVDSDAQKFYKEKFNQEYKALPHNWQFTLKFWHWNAPFADRITVDHVAAMTNALFYEDIERRRFGLDRGIEGPQGKTVADPQGTNIPDTARLISELKDDNNFNDPRRLAILLAIAVRGGLDKEVTSKVLQPREAAHQLSGESLAVVESYGFTAKNGFQYHDEDLKKNAEHDASYYWYFARRTLFSWNSGSVAGEQRGTFDLRHLQEADQDRLHGSLGGLRIGTQPQPRDDYYNSTWLDEAVKAHEGSGNLLANLRETKGADRQGKIFVSIRDDIHQANIWASSLPIEGLNLFSAGSLTRSGPGVIQGLQVHLSWTKDTIESDNEMELQVGIDNVLINQLEIISPGSTLTLGELRARGLYVRMKQGNLKAASGLFLGFLKNADFTLVALMELLPHVLTLLPYAVLTMVEEFKGAREHKYKDKLGNVLKNDFSSLDAGVTFLSLGVRDMYDTQAGFLEDISIEQRGKDNELQRQGVLIGESISWGMDALFHLRDKIRLIDEEIRARKSEVAGNHLAQEMTDLEKEQRELIKKASEKQLALESASKEMERLRTIMGELQRKDSELNKAYEAAKPPNPDHKLTPFDVLDGERKRLKDDLDYIDTGYFKDKQAAAGSDSVKRFEARQQMEAFEAKYKSVDVRLALRGVALHGGNYVRDMINDLVGTLGFVDPKLEGIENINIGAVDSAFTASGLGVAQYQDATGVTVKGLHVPRLTAKAVIFKTGSMEIKAGSPRLEDLHVAAAIHFAKNPLAKDPAKPYSWVLKSADIGKATLNGLTLKVGGAAPILNFPEAVPVRAWGISLSDYNPDAKTINLKIQDVQAAGAYSDKTPDKKSGQPQSTEIAFGVDTTVDGQPRVKQAPAVDLRYDPKENSIATRVNLRSATIQSLAIDSPTLRVTSSPDARAVQLDELSAGVKVTFGEEKQGNKPAVPMVVEITDVHLGKLTAQGIVLQSFEAEETGETAKTKTGPKTIQEVALPAGNPIEIDDIRVKGLRITLDEKETRFGAIGEDASIEFGKSDLSGITSKEKTARGSVLQAFSLQKGKFDSFTLEAIHRAGRSYNQREFLQFFGRTRLAGADFEGTYQKGKTSVSVGVKGKSNVPISIDRVEPGGDAKGYYRIRLPLSRLTVPALDIEKDGGRIVIPRAASAATTTVASDLDVTLNVYLDFDAAGSAVYDVYLESLSVGDLKVYGLEYHNKAKGIDVKLDPAQPLHIPNVTGRGFRFSSFKGLEVFGKDGGWLKAGAAGQVLSAHAEKISAELQGVLAKKADGRSALDIDIESIGFRLDQAGGMTISLGKIAGGFPKMSITQVDEKTKAKTVTTIGTKSGKTITVGSLDITLNPDGSKVFDAKELKAGDLTVTSVETAAADVTTTSLTLGPEALGAKSAQVKLNKDGSKEITIRNITGGQIDVDRIATGAAGKSENKISLPDTDAIVLEELKINIDADGVRHFTAVRPTLKNVQLRSLSQTPAGDYVSVVADIAVKGNVEMGDGQFATLTFGKPADAFIGVIAEKTPIEITNMKLEIKDTSKTPPSKDEPPKPLTADQQKLIELEKALDAAEKKLDANPPSRPVRGGGTMPNPQWAPAYDAYQKAKKAYDDQRAGMIKGAKTAAQQSIEKKYLDAVFGKVTGNLHVFDSEIPVNIETDDGTLYLELSSEVTDALKEIIRSLIGKTADMKFWSSDEMKAIGRGLQRWWIPGTADDWIKAIAAGNAVNTVKVLLRNIKIWPGVVETNKDFYGINLNIEGSWALDIASEFTRSDEIGIELCELQYKHPTKKNFYSLYGMMEYRKFVSPALVSVSDEADEARLQELAKAFADVPAPSSPYKTEAEVSDMGIKDAVRELKLFIRSNLLHEAKRLGNTLKDNIKGVDLTADVGVRPQEVINALLAERKQGSFQFDKEGKDTTIWNVHVEADYVNNTDPKGLVRVGTGPQGQQNLPIPGGTYLSEDKGTKVSYGDIDLAPLSMLYENDVYRVRSKSATIDGIKFGVKNPPKK